MVWSFFAYFLCKESRGQKPFGSFYIRGSGVHNLFTFRIFRGSYPLCKGVIHVENVENPVERVENYPGFSVENVENLVESPL